MNSDLKNYIKTFFILKESIVEEISPELKFHIKENIPLSENVFRPGSESFFDLFSEARELYENNKIKLIHEEDLQMLEDDIGYWGIYEGKYVPLDYPMLVEELDDIFMPSIEEDYLFESKKGKTLKKKKAKKRKKKEKKEKKEKKVELNKPKRNYDGDKPYIVHTMDPKTGKVITIKYGSPSMSRPWNDKERNKSFVARHGCGTDRASDKTKARYWACRTPRDFSKQKNKPRFW